tara:strand:- start:2454 stop:3089 length:636 start_codon:yes stop_codon:yes gene_type:complete
MSYIKKRNKNIFRRNNLKKSTKKRNLKRKKNIKTHKKYDGGMNDGDIDIEGLDNIKIPDNFNFDELDEAIEASRKEDRKKKPASPIDNIRETIKKYPQAAKDNAEEIRKRQEEKKQIDEMKAAMLEDSDDEGLDSYEKFSPPPGQKSSIQDVRKCVEDVCDPKGCWGQLTSKKRGGHLKRTKRRRNKNSLKVLKKRVARKTNKRRLNKRRK